VPYSIQPAETVSGAVQRITLEQLDRALASIENPDVPRTEAVYALRKRCKKVRAVVRLARGPLEGLGLYRSANAELRDIAAVFSGLRDADVMLATYDRALAAFDQPGRRTVDLRAFGPIRAALTRRRRALLSEEGGMDIAALLEEAHWLLLKFRLGIANWDFPEDGFAAVEPGLRKTYARVLRSGEEAREQGTVDAMHEWRKRVKYHRNHLRLLKKLAPKTLAPRIQTLWRLGDVLGLYNDLAVVHDQVQHDPGFWAIKARRRFLILLARQRRAVQAEAMAAADAAGFPSEDETISRLAGLWNIGMNRPIAARLVTGRRTG